MPLAVIHTLQLLRLSKGADLLVATKQVSTCRCVVIMSDVHTCVGHDKSEVLEVAELKAKVAQLNTELAKSKAHIQATQMVVAASPLRSQNELRAKVEGPVVATCTER